MMSLCHAKMSAISNSNLGDIWRSKRQQPVSQWCKQMVEREKSETQTKKRTIQILSRAQEINPEKKPVPLRNKGLARSERLWEIYCNKPDPVMFDRPAKMMRSSWPDAGVQTPTEQLPGQLESGEESSRLYEEKDFWGYFLPSTLYTKERDVSWGLSVPTDWKSPVNLSFPIPSLEDEKTLENSQEIYEDPNEVLSKKPKSKMLELFKLATTEAENENKTSVPEDPSVSLEKTDLESKAEELPEKNSSSEIEKSENSSDVTISCSDEDKKTNVSGNLNPSRRDLLFGTPPRSNPRKRRTLSGINDFLEVYEGCKFYRSNSSPVLTVI